ncbi:aminodeoxychorismate lyase [Marinobacterium aestuarii]|uniref:Aminodeoxychorismate lyase n=1 Tax=Marinobacterium aestuarii TaxID=1821621 RepID=A0A1A9EYE0_9GAMM|nr:aminodeoxychorismate lyase [Marinobacterium aestuarii]ANG62668.1 aminodeoxychorismate lyase [Marinobacterium aestuarii]
MNKSPFTLINGVAADSVAVTDRGLAYGDGLFETVQLRAGRPLLLDLHLERLRSGCERLAIKSPTLFDDLQSDLEHLARLCSMQDFGVLKILVTRGAGGRGYLPQVGMAPTRIVIVSVMPDYPHSPAQAGVRVRWCDMTLALSPRLAGIKHLNRLEQVLARSEWDDPDIREGLLCDTEGFVVEGTMSNLLWVRGKVLHAPLLDRCGVAGVVRKRVLQLAAAAGIEVLEGRFGKSELEQADEIMLCNSLIDIWPVVTLDARHWSVGPVTRALQSLLAKDYLAC